MKKNLHTHLLITSVAAPLFINAAMNLPGQIPAPSLHNLVNIYFL